MCNCPTICHLNDYSIFVCISSLKFAVLGTVSYIYEFDIICVTETWLKSSVLNDLRLPGFCSLFGFEPNRRGDAVFECPTICHLNDCSIFVCISSLKFAVLGTVAIGKPERHVHKSFALWQQATMEFTCHDHSIIACSRHICMVFSTHIPFVVNHKFNATPPERLQQYSLLYL